jgi:hypothetical protein
VFSLVIENVFAANISLYMGEIEKTIFSGLLPIAGAVFRVCRKTAKQAKKLKKSQGSGILKA